MNPQTRKWLYRSGWIALILLVGLAYLLGRMTAGGGSTAPHDHAQDSAQEGVQATNDAPAAEGDGPATMYTCSMHPQVRSPNPDDLCPICGMALIPVPTEAADAGDADLPRLAVSPRAAALMQIQTQPAERRAVQVPVRLFGRVDYDETRQRTIAAWISGRLDRLHVDFTGVAVEAGQPMVEIYSPQLVAAQQELLEAQRTVEQMAEGGLPVIRESARQTLAAARDRLRLLGLRPEQISELEQRGTVEDTLTINAPVSGVVVERMASEGEYVETGQPIYRLADLSHLWVRLDVFESDLRWISLGQAVTFTTQSYPGETFEGSVSFIDPVVTGETRTVRVRVDVPNPDGCLRPGMFVRGTLDAATGEGEPPLVIPASAPLITGRRAIVYVQLPDADRPTFEAREVTLGARAGEWAIVRDGLEAGEQVVTNGAFKIDSELQIRGRPSMMSRAEPEAREAPAEAAVEADAAPAFTVPASFAATFGELLRANFVLVDALADDDAEAAREAARLAREALAAVDANELGAEAQHTWHELHAAMIEGLDAIIAAEDLAAQRPAFERFSNHLTLAVRSFGSGPVTPVYRMVCPMVEGREGFWLQPHPTVTNPYFGASMLRCGDVAQTLAPPADEASAAGEAGSDDHGAMGHGGH